MNSLVLSLIIVPTVQLAGQSIYLGEQTVYFRKEAAPLCVSPLDVLCRPSGVPVSALSRSISARSLYLYPLHS